MNSMLTARHFIIFLTLVAALGSCKSNNRKDSETQSTTQEKILNTEKLQSQTFTISSDRDTVIKGKSGTVLRIYKNTFVDKDGKQLKGNIEVELKEALTANDIILSGLTTTSNGQLLETGGMIYLNATAHGQQLEIASDKFIGTIIPSNKMKKGMKLFEGELDSSGMNWKNPKKILNDKLIAQNLAKEHLIVSDSVKVVIKEGTKSEIDAILDYVKSDTSKPENPKPIRKKIKAVKQQEIAKAEDDIFLNEINNEKGTNLFLEDNQSSYIFSLKNLGWANIDMLYQDPRTKEVEFITDITNAKEFKTIYVTLIVTNQSMYIPGYQRKDGTFSFTHDDEEEVRLPIGETATILATTYKEGKPYYSIKTIKISEKQKVEIKLEETTEDKLKDILTKRI